MGRFRYSYFLVLVPVALVFPGCEQVPKQALKIEPETFQQRQLHTRVFDTSEEHRILSACASLLQDAGFKLDESETDLGLLVACEDRDARDTGQVIAATAWWLALGVLADARYDYKQQIRASVVTSPAGSSVGRTAVRVTFQRIVWDQTNRISRVQHFEDREIYEKFFEKLSVALSLEAHRI